MAEEDEAEVEIVFYESHQQAALDRAYLFAKIVEENLLSEDFVQMVPEIAGLVEKAVDLLNLVYQRIGGLEFEEGVWIDRSKSLDWDYFVNNY